MRARRARPASEVVVATGRPASSARSADARAVGRGTQKLGYRWDTSKQPRPLSNQWLRGAGVTVGLDRLCERLGQVHPGMRPAPLPDGWNEYLEELWDAWALTLDRLKPVDEPMSFGEIASVQYRPLQSRRPAVTEHHRLPLRDLRRVVMDGQLLPGDVLSTTSWPTTLVRAHLHNDNATMAWHEMRFGNPDLFAPRVSSTASKWARCWLFGQRMVQLSRFGSERGQRSPLAQKR
jgi:hypothetical protein